MKDYIQILQQAITNGFPTDSEMGNGVELLTGKTLEVPFKFTTLHHNVHDVFSVIQKQKNVTVHSQHFQSFFFLSNKSHEKLQEPCFNGVKTDQQYPDT